MLANMSPPPTPSFHLHSSPLDPQSLYLLVTMNPGAHTPHYSLHITSGSTAAYTIEACFIHNRWALTRSHALNYSDVEQLGGGADMLLALKLAHVEDMLRQPMSLRADQVKIAKSNKYGIFSARTWVLQALYEFENEGYIDLKKRIEDIDIEVADLVRENSMMPQRKRTLVLTSKAYKH